MKLILALSVFCAAATANAATGEWIYGEAFIKFTQMNDQFGNCYEGTSNDLDGEITFKIDETGTAPAPMTLNLSAGGTNAKVIMSAVKPANAEPNLKLNVVVIVSNKTISETELGMWHRWPASSVPGTDPTRLPDFKHVAYSQDDACPDRVDIEMKRVYAVPMD